MKYNSFFAFSISLFLIVFFSACTEHRGPLKPIRYIGSYTRDFNDLNDLHLKVAQSIGITPVTSREEAEKYKKKLKEVESNEHFQVLELTHSLPFLVPKAHDLLEKIGANFTDSLKSLNAPLYKLRVTSVLRTDEDVSKLRKRNVNSTKNSAHLYGTTFDIGWNRYIRVNEKDTLELKPEQLKMVLASVLRDLKKADACYIKHEKKQGCFHITAR